MRGLWATFAGAALLAVLSYTTVHAQVPKQAASPAASKEVIERGRYIVKISGCNDCHTSGYAGKGGVAPEIELLKGDTLGFRGPWGTTYATNLRLNLSKMTEEEWVTYGKNLMTRPPMPWFNIRAMTEVDLKAVYQYVKSLGPSGSAAPAFLPPDKAPKQPYIQWPGVK